MLGSYYLQGPHDILLYPDQWENGNFSGGPSRAGGEERANWGAHMAVSKQGCSSLQNGKLLAERDGVKRRSEELATEKDALKVQHLCEGLLTSPHPSQHCSC